MTAAPQFIDLEQHRFRHRLWAFWLLGLLCGCGAALVLGVCILYTTVADWVVDFLGQFFDSWWLYNILLRDVPRLAVTIGIIALGVWFIRGPKAPPADDIPAFTPPPADKEDGHGEL